MAQGTRTIPRRSENGPPPRLAPRLPLPPRAYTPGRRGGKPAPRPGPISPWSGDPPFDPARADEAFRAAADLFNHGYYWEAHEIWEAMWNARARAGAEAAVLKALIALAAAGLKLREGRPRGVRRHAERAHALVRGLAERGTREVLGLSLEELGDVAAAVRDGGPGSPYPAEDSPSAVVFDFYLAPRAG